MNWTAVGITQDGNTMIVIVGPNLTPTAMRDRMLAEGAYNAIKMDGGGSSTLYYDGNLRFIGEGSEGRAVADALLVFVQ
jgi:exopolysaccharide biosynthesis protein